MAHKIDDKRLGALCYTKSRAVRPAIASLQRKGKLPPLEEVTQKDFYGPRFLLSKEEAKIVINYGPVGRRENALNALEAIFLQMESVAQEAAPVEPISKKMVEAATEAIRMELPVSVALVETGRSSSQEPNQATPPREEPEEAPKYPLVAIKKAGKLAFQDIFELEVCLGDDGNRYIYPNALAEALNLSVRGFNERIDRRFSSGVRVSSADEAAPTRMLNIYFVPGVLHTITPSRVEKSKRPALERMQEELTQALGQYVFEGNASNPGFSQEERETARNQQDAKIQQQLEGMQAAILNISSDFNKLTRSMDSAIQAIPGLIRSSIPTPATPAEINEETHAAVERIDPNGKDSCRAMADNLGIPYNSMKDILVHLGLVGDPNYGSWYGVATGRHGNTSKENWTNDIDKTMPIVAPAVAKFIEFRFKYKNAGFKDFAKKALKDALDEFKAVGMGTHTDLTRRKLNRRGNPFEPRTE